MNSKIQQQKEQFDKYMHQRDIIKDMDDHLLNLHESYQEDQNQDIETNRFEEQSSQNLGQQQVPNATNEFLDQTWQKEKEQLINQKRYPAKDMSKPRRELEHQIFDLERKKFYQEKTYYILRNFFKNAIRRERLLKVIAFHRFVRNASLAGSNQFLQQSYTFNPKQPLMLQESNSSNLSKQSSKLRNRSKSPLQKSQSTNQLYKVHGAYKVLNILNKKLPTKKQRLYRAFFKWMRLMFNLRNAQQVHEMKQINFILNERVFRENLFRTKARLAQTDIESKIQISNELLSQLIQVQK